MLCLLQDIFQICDHSGDARIYQYFPYPDM